MKNTEGMEMKREQVDLSSSLASLAVVTTFWITGFLSVSGPSSFLSFQALVYRAALWF